MTREESWPDKDYAEDGVLGIWTACRDIEEALANGAIDNFLPAPGDSFDIKKAEALMDKMEEKWEQEWATRAGGHLYTGALEFTKLPVLAKLWLYNRIEKEKQNPVYQSKRKPSQGTNVNEFTEE